MEKSYVSQHNVDTVFAGVLYTIRERHVGTVLTYIYTTSGL